MSEDPEVIEQRALRAKQLLEDSLIADAFKAIEERWVYALRYSALSGKGPALREQSRWMLAALDEFRAELQRHLTSGTVARTEAEQQQWLAEKMRQDREDFGE